MIRTSRADTVQKALACAAFVALAWSALVWLTHGVAWTIGGLKISSRDPLRPLLAGVACLIGAAWYGGPSGLLSQIDALMSRVSGRAIAAVAALGVVAAGLMSGGASAVDADSYGYVSQADLWISGSLHQPQPSALKVPWPNAQWSFSPLGYKPSLDGASIVPTYAPGLPIVMAAFKAIGGQKAVALVVPLCAALLVIATFLIGRLVASEGVGAAAACLVATSPTALSQTMWPMSDVPSAAFGAVMFYGYLSESRVLRTLGGVGALLMILTRPNLVVIWVVAALMMVWRDRSMRPATRLLIRSAPAVVPALVAVTFIAWLNRHLYGSGTTSGYGSLFDIFTIRTIPTNLAHYGSWLMQAEPLAVLGVIYLLLPRLLLREPALGRGSSIAIVAAVTVPYLAYTVFDQWWYLRFLLPAWPLLMVAGACLAFAIRGSARRLVGCAAIIVAGLHGLSFARDHAAFDADRGQRRAIGIAEYVGDATDARSVIITVEHSGSVRFYGGRLTVRFDYIDPAWLDRAIDWLASDGAHPYILVDAAEKRGFIERYSAANARENLDALDAVLRMGDGDPTVLYDPLQPAGATRARVVSDIELLTPRSRDKAAPPAFFF